MHAHANKTKPDKDGALNKASQTSDSGVINNQQDYLPGTYQAMANKSLQTKQAMQLQAMADRYTSRNYGKATTPPVLQLVRKKQKPKTKPSGKEPENVKYREETPHTNQTSVQKYLAAIAPAAGPIRAYITQNATKNDGLCAGWVALHRRNPELLIAMWEEATENIEEWEEMKKLNPAALPPQMNDTNKAVEIYMKAHDHFVGENPGEDYEHPDTATKIAAGFENTQDPEADAGREYKMRVKYGKFMEAAKSVADKVLKPSQKGLTARQKDKINAEVFIEIYSTEHEAQVQLVDGKVKSVCESDKAGILATEHEEYAESILTSAFFKSKDDHDQETEVTMIAHHRLT